MVLRKYWKHHCGGNHPYQSNTVFHRSICLYWSDTWNRCPDRYIWPDHSNRWRSPSRWKNVPGCPDNHLRNHASWIYLSQRYSSADSTSIYLPSASLTFSEHRCRLHNTTYSGNGSMYSCTSSLCAHWHLMLQRNSIFCRSLFFLLQAVLCY